MSSFNQIAAFFSVNTIAFEILSYPMSYIEFIGTIFYLWSVWLISRKNMLTWPIGIISVIIFFFLFYQIQLYSDAIEQLYYLGASIYGWWYWKKDIQNQDDDIKVIISRGKLIISWAVSTLVLSIITSFFMQRIHLIFPAVFPEPASYPFIDALTTIMSFSAMFLMAQKRIESWVYWILVDIIGIWLYYVKDVKFLSLLYVILLAMAINGLRIWFNKRV
ncbi:nicotinamide riboside transporter PnuC [Desulfobacterales bacterium HSG17]|nr:nicotinamide riboside transporter PnuC [Desulfobacterales bacterium HSG17]